MKRVLLVLGMLWTLGAGLVVAQETPDEPNAELEELMADLEDVTRAIRQLDGVAVERSFPTRADVTAYLSDQYDLQTTPVEARKYWAFYTALDLLDPSIDLREVYLSLLSSQVAGFYDTDTKIMNVVPSSDEPVESLSVMQQVIYVHEYTHALQDQFFNLGEMQDASELIDSVDRSMALTSMIAGDATAVMTVFTQELAQANPFAAIQMLGESLLAGNLVLPAGVPDILVQELTYPYEGGMEFVAALYDEGGWDLINAAYSNPPASMEQIIHPEKYIAGEGPIAVTLEDGTAELGAGWEQVWETTVGEWYLREHLRVHLPNRDAADALAGWGGDRIRIYTNAETDEVAWVLRVAWDTTADAAEFEQAYQTFAAERHGADETDGCWSDDTSTTCVMSGDQETWISRAPAQEQAAGLLSVQQ